jgi:hypothetical protein
MEMFKKGTKVKFEINQAYAVLRGKGVVVKPVPKNAERGAARLEVLASDGRTIRPYPSQCKPA